MLWREWLLLGTTDLSFTQFLTHMGASALTAGGESFPQGINGEENGGREIRSSRGRTPTYQPHLTGLPPVLE